jgi:hypothetical protein
VRRKERRGRGKEGQGKEERGRGKEELDRGKERGKGREGESAGGESKLFDFFQVFIFLQYSF